MYRPPGPQDMAAPMGESLHLATMRAGQGESRSRLAAQDAPFQAAQVIQRAAGDGHHAAVQAQRRLMLPMTQAAVEAVTNNRVDPRVAQVLQGAKRRALLNLGAGSEQARLVEMGAQAAGGILPVG